MTVSGISKQHNSNTNTNSNNIIPTINFTSVIDKNRTTSPTSSQNCLLYSLLASRGPTRPVVFTLFVDVFLVIPRQCQHVCRWHCRLYKKLQNLTKNSAYLSKYFLILSSLDKKNLKNSVQNTKYCWLSFSISLLWPENYHLKIRFSWLKLKFHLETKHLDTLHIFSS